jgi:hypothetical protein
MKAWAYSRRFLIIGGSDADICAALLGISSAGSLVIPHNAFINARSVAPLVLLTVRAHF